VHQNNEHGTEEQKAGVRRETSVPHMEKPRVVENPVVAEKLSVEETERPSVVEKLSVDEKAPVVEKPSVVEEPVFNKRRSIAANSANKTAQVLISEIPANKAPPGTPKEETNFPGSSKAPQDGSTEETLSDEPKDLWREAFKKLQDSKPDVARRLNTETNCSGRNQVEGIIRQVDLVKEKYEKNGWKYVRVKNGQEVEINVRDAAFKMLDGLIKFKSLVDAGLKFDPTGYGELNYKL
jgi:hypothetical protein